MIEGLMWDMGKVVIDFDIPASNRILAARCGKTEDEVNKIIYKDSGEGKHYNKGLVQDLNLGIESFEQFYEKVRKALNLDMGIVEFEQVWRGVLTRQDTNIVRFIHLMQQRMYKQCVISSTNPVQWDEMNRLSAIDGCTIEDLLGKNHIITTYKVGATKPSRELFEAGRKSLGNLPESMVVYIDDVNEYVKAAEKLGYKGVFFDEKDPMPQHDCIEKLINLGISL